MGEAMKNRSRKVFLLLFLLYALFLCYVLLFRASPEFIKALLAGAELSPREVHLVPLETTLFYLFHYNKRMFIDNVLANYAVFIPLGFFFAGFCPRFKQRWTVFLIGAAASLGIEIIQLIFHLGEFDVDDILLNAFGMWTGTQMMYGVWKSGFCRSLRRKPRNQS